MRGQRESELNNAGFSLVELLVAVTVLSIIVVPLLHSFVTAARTNAKSADKMHATSIAEDVMEQFEAADVDAMAEKYTELKNAAATAATTTVEHNTDGTYHFRYRDSTTTSGSYDVDIKVDPSEYSNSENTGYNNAELVDIQNLTGTVNAVFSEDSATYSQAVSYFNGYANSSATTTQIKAAIQKTVEITITTKNLSLKLDSDKTQTVPAYQVYANVSYSCDSTVLKEKAPTQYPTGGSSYLVFSNEDYLKNQASAIAAGTSESTEAVSRLANIFLLLQPTGGGLPDLVTVDNSANIETTVYLVNQTTSGTTPSYEFLLQEDAGSWMSASGASGVHKERTGDLANHSYATLRTNLLELTGITYGFENTKNGEKISGEARYDSSSKGYVNVTGTGGADAMKILDADDMTPVSSGDRIYNITVEVYREGETSDPIVSMTGTVTK